MNNYKRIAGLQGPVKPAVTFGGTNEIVIPGHTPNVVPDPPQIPAHTIENPEHESALPEEILVTEKGSSVRDFQDVLQSLLPTFLLLDHQEQQTVLGTIADLFFKGTAPGQVNGGAPNSKPPKQPKFKLDSDRYPDLSPRNIKKINSFTDQLAKIHSLSTEERNSVLLYSGAILGFVIPKMKYSSPQGTSKTSYYSQYKNSRILLIETLMTRIVELVQITQKIHTYLKTQKEKPQKTPMGNTALPTEREASSNPDSILPSKKQAYQGVRDNIELLLNSESYTWLDSDNINDTEKAVSYVMEQFMKHVQAILEPYNTMQETLIPKDTRTLGLSGIKLTSEIMGKLAVEFQTASKLETLTIGFQTLTPTESKALGTALNACPKSVHTVTFSNNDLRMDTVLNQLNSKNGLHTLRIVGCKLSSDEIKALANFIKNNKTITTLDLDKIEVEGKDMSKLVNAINGSKIKTLTLSALKCDTNNFDALSQLNCASLQDLQSSFNDHITAPTFSDILSNNKALKTLDISYCSFQNQPNRLEALVTGINKSTSLETLTLSHMELNNPDLETLGTIKCTTLRNLNLSYNKISDIHALTTILTSNKKLKHLDLTSNYIQDLEPIAKAIEQCQLETLILSQNGMKLCEHPAQFLDIEEETDHEATARKKQSNQHAEALNAANMNLGNLPEKLKANKHLKVLNLRDCGITDEHAEVLADMLKSNTKLQSLILHSNHSITNKGFLALANSLLTNNGVSLNFIRCGGEVVKETVKEKRKEVPAKTTGIHPIFTTVLKDLQSLKPFFHEHSLSFSLLKTMTNTAELETRCAGITKTKENIEVLKVEYTQESDELKFLETVFTKPAILDRLIFTD
ncbi:leucine-rich repeat domain-containing protein [Thermoproteota archaeon]